MIILAQRTNQSAARLGRLNHLIGLMLASYPLSCIQCSDILGILRFSLVFITVGSMLAFASRRTFVRAIVSGAFPDVILVPITLGMGAHRLQM